MRTAIYLAISLALSQTATPQTAIDLNAPSNVLYPPREPQQVSSIPFEYIGSNSRVGVNVDNEGEVSGELFGVFGFSGKHAFLAEAYAGDSDTLGAKLGYHWLWGVGDPAADNFGEHAVVSKLFLAFDQNSFRDQKATLGLGFEKNSSGLNVYYSRGLTDERLVNSQFDSVTETITGDQNGRPFEQDITTDTLTELFEQPYDEGVGFRLEHFFDKAHVRVRGGLDFQRGDNFLGDQSAIQRRSNLGVEKFFEGSGHSLGLDLNYADKFGPFDGSALGEEPNQLSASVQWRYAFGQPYRAAQAFTDVEVAAEPVAVPAPQVIQNELALSGEALFEFDKAIITEAAKSKLSLLLDKLKGSRIGQIKIIGHTCDLGSVSYNQDLSERRANAFAQYLMANGIAADQLDVSALGETSPKVPNDSDEHRQQNRRIELSFVTVEESTVTPEAPTPGSTWAREEIKQKPAWIERALRNMPAHNRTVDTYRSQKQTVTRTEGPIVFINRAPDAIDDALSTAFETQTAVIEVLANDTDPDPGDVITVTSFTNTTNGTVTQTGNTFLYTPNAGFEGDDTFTYTIIDQGGLTDTATVTVTVQPNPNLAPDAVDDNNDFFATPGVPLTIDVLINDSDPENDTLTILSVQDIVSGATVDIANGNLVYTSAPGFEGADSFSYTIDDGNGGTDSATVILTVLPAVVNAAPDAIDDIVSTTEATPTAAIDVLTNDTDANGDALTITSVGTANNGTVVHLQSDNTIVYTPNTGFTGTDQFNYTISDGQGGTDTATIFVTVIAPNLAPTAVDDNNDFFATPGVPLTIDVLINDTDPENDALTIVSVQDIVSGATVDIVNGQLVYTSAPGFEGADSFTYTIDDSNGSSDSATVVLTVLPAVVNVAPVAVDDALSTPLDTPTAPISVLLNDTDANGDALTITAVGTANNGTVVHLQSDNTIVYTPNAGFTGTDQFTYTIGDGNGLTDIATVTITVQQPNPNLAPDAVDDNVDLVDTPTAAIDVLVNDTDANGDTLTVTAVGAANNGTVVQTNNTLVYTPNAGFVGTDQFTYTIDDGNGLTDTATVTITVPPNPNLAPEATDDDVSTTADTPTGAIDVLVNDTDANGDTLTVTAVGAANNGTVVQTNNTLVYTPNAGFVGTDQFTYDIDDGNGLADTATVFVTVTAQNFAPTAVNDVITTKINTASVALDLTANDTDPEGDALTVISLDPGVIGTVALQGNSVVYTPRSNLFGQDGFGYQISDGNNNVSFGSVLVNVIPNSAPKANNDVITTTINTASVALDLTANDTDPEGDALTVISVDTGVIGTVSLQGNSVVYTPRSNLFGQDGFGYQISDGNNNVSFGFVFVNVSPP